MEAKKQTRQYEKVRTDRDQTKQDQKQTIKTKTDEEERQTE